MSQKISIALVGNPNSGKTSLFNALTGLNQKVGNFPGVTVDKKVGHCTLPNKQIINIIDLPGTYSLYPKSEDEKVTHTVLLDYNNPDKPDMAIVIADSSNLKRNLLLCSQIIDLKIPVIIVLTMMDIAKTKGLELDIIELEKQFNTPIIIANPRKGEGINDLKNKIQSLITQNPNDNNSEDFIDFGKICGNWIKDVKKISNVKSDYAAFQLCCQLPHVAFLQAAQKIQLSALIGESNIHKSKIQAEEILERYRKINAILKTTLKEPETTHKVLKGDKLDKILLHPVWGNIILIAILFLVFQSVFSFSSYPMEWVESGFSSIGSFLTDNLPHGLFTDLLVNGLLAGISGVAVFIPQIMILFGFITILEDTGYMARISFLTDRLMRSVGLNGRSVMPMISGMACAVPAIMSARTIQNKKERLITIMVTPLMSCSARLPVYTILIGLVIPDVSFWGIFNLQGLVLMGLYFLGFIMALIVSKVMSAFTSIREKSFFMMELPVYRMPRWKNVFITMYQKARIFVVDAGKVILIISLILWALCSFGPPKRFEQIEQKYALLQQLQPTQVEQLNAEMSNEKLKNSYAGIMGHFIEPAIRPMGYDWKIGIAIISSFAAREVFVGTMATLYSVGSADNDISLREKLKEAKRSDGSPVYTLGTGVSLLLFYVFAMQCISTMVITRKETKSWKYPLYQFLYMDFLAIIFAYTAYQLLS